VYPTRRICGSPTRADHVGDLRHSIASVHLPPHLPRPPNQPRDPLPPPVDWRWWNRPSLHRQPTTRQSASSMHRELALQSPLWLFASLLLLHLPALRRHRLPWCRRRRRRAWRPPRRSRTSMPRAESTSPRSRHLLPAAATSRMHSSLASARSVSRRSRIMARRRLPPRPRPRRRWSHPHQSLLL
jgi:hypothetical protein